MPQLGGEHGVCRVPAAKAQKGPKRAHRAGPRPIAPRPAEVARRPARALPARPGAESGRLGTRRGTVPRGGPPRGCRPPLQGPPPPSAAAAGEAAAPSGGAAGGRGEEGGHGGAPPAGVSGTHGRHRKSESIELKLAITKGLPQTRAKLSEAASISSNS